MTTTVVKKGLNDKTALTGLEEVQLSGNLKTTLNIIKSWLSGVDVYVDTEWMDEVNAELLKLLLGSRRVTSIRTVTSASTSLEISDVGGIVRMDNTNANTVTVPLQSEVAFDDYATITIRQIGEGTTTIVATEGVTINSASLELAAQNSAVQLVKVSDDVWDLYGAEAVA